MNQQLSTPSKIFLSVLFGGLIVLIAILAPLFLEDYQIVDGRLVGMEYTAGYSGSVVSSRPGVQTTFVSEKFTLLIDVNGTVSSYSVSVHTYSKALAGQIIFPMKCNKILCTLIE